MRSNIMVDPNPELISYAAPAGVFLFSSSCHKGRPSSADYSILLICLSGLTLKLDPKNVDSAYLAPVSGICNLLFL